VRSASTSDDDEDGIENELQSPELLLTPCAIRRASWDHAARDVRLGESLLERWRLWFELARLGRWGGVVAEQLVRAERIGAVEGDRESAAETLRARYPALWYAGPSPVEATPHPQNAWLPESLPFAEPAAVGGDRRMLLVVPWLEVGGADKFN